MSEEPPARDYDLLAEVGGHDLGLAGHLLGCAVGEDAAGVEHVHLVAHVEHERNVVLDEQHGAAQVVAQLAQPIGQVLHRRRRHAGRRLVEHQQLGCGHEGAGQLHDALLAARQVAHGHVGLVGEAEGADDVD
jgi:hypothetical protein